MSRRVAAITLALIATLGCQAPEDRARQRLAAGDAHLSKGALRDARLEYEAALELAPKLIPARMRHVALLVAEERYEEALVRVRRLAADAPTSSQAVGLWGTVLMRLGRLEEAEPRYRRAVELDPSSPHALTDYASLLVENGANERALALYETAAAAGGLSAPALMRWAEALSRAGQEDAALLRLEAAYASAPELPGLARKLGERLVGTDAARAVELLEAALRTEGGDAELLATLGTAYLGAARWYESRNFLRRAVAAATDASTRAELAHQIAAVDAARPAPRAAADLPNVVFFVVDTLRADRVGAYGHERATTPRIDQLAEAGVVMESASSQAPWTAASIATLFTSLYPSVHGIDGGVVWGGGAQAGALPFATQRTLGGSQLTLAEHLRRSGYATAGFVSNVYVNSIFGFAQGFETFHDEHADYSGDVVRLKRRASETNRLVLDWIDGDLAEPFFLLVHYNDPHWPYAPPAPFGSAWLDAEALDPAYRDHLNSRIHTAGAPLANPGPREREQLLALYDGEIAYADHHLGVVVDALQRRDLKRPLMTIVSSDHGEEFLDHGSTSHGHTLYEELLRVPLIFHWPGRLAPRRVSTPVGLVDVAPTLLELLGLDTDTADTVFQGRSFAAGLGGASLEARPVFAEATYTGDRRSIQTLGLKLIESRDPAALELFDLAADAAELRNLAASRQTDTARLEATLHEWERSNGVTRSLAGGPGPSLRLDEATRERLRALGYLR